MCDKMCMELEKLMIIYRRMFPYNEEENTWISNNANSGIKLAKHSLIYSLLCALLTAIFSTIIPPLVYFSRANLF